VNDLDLDLDPALASAVLEIETHIAEGGWDQPARLYALVATERLVQQESALAAAMGLDDSAAQGSLTPVEQDQLAPDQPLEAVLQSISWPAGVTGCARRRRRTAGAPARGRRADPAGPGRRAGVRA
jgi:hypothetical protein